MTKPPPNPEGAMIISLFNMRPRSEMYWLNMYDFDKSK